MTTASHQQRLLIVVQPLVRRTCVLPPEQTVQRIEGFIQGTPPATNVILCGTQCTQNQRVGWTRRAAVIAVVVGWSDVVLHCMRDDLLQRCFLNILSPPPCHHKRIAAITNQPKSDAMASTNTVIRGEDCRGHNEGVAGDRCIMSWQMLGPTLECMEGSCLSRNLSCNIVQSSIECPQP